MKYMYVSSQPRAVPYQDAKCGRIHKYVCGVRTTILICVAQKSVVPLRDEANPYDNVPYYREIDLKDQMSA
jgi:hypothetical protein